MTKLLRLLRSQEAATAIEYGLIAALLCVGSIVSFKAFGNSAMNMWTTVQNKAAESMTP